MKKILIVLAATLTLGSSAFAEVPCNEDEMVSGYLAMWGKRVFDLRDDAERCCTNNDFTSVAYDLYLKGYVCKYTQPEN